MAPAISNPNAVTLDATNVYWGDNGLNTCPKTGCGDSGATALGPGGGAPGGLFVEGGNLVGGCGGTPTTILSTSDGILVMTLDATSLFWTTNKALMTCALANCGSTTTQLATIRLAASMAVNATAIYWTDYGIAANDVWVLAR